MRNDPELIAQRLAESVEIKTALLADRDALELIGAIAEAIATCLRKGGKILLAGNGGSFADSIHIAAEFVGRFELERAPLACVALGANNSILTAIGNDYDYRDVFARELKALGRPGDLFLCISTSGNSENVIRAVEAATEMGLETCCFTGRTGGRLSGMCTCLKIASDITARIQEVHITVAHIICELVERGLFEQS